MHGTVIIEEIGVFTNLFPATGDLAFGICIIFAAAINSPAIPQCSVRTENINFVFKLMNASIAGTDIISGQCSIIFLAVYLEPSGLKRTIASEPAFFAVFCDPFVGVTGTGFLI